MSELTEIPADNIRLKRAYEPAEPSDGKRYLVDRLWPRGISREKAELTGGWLKELAPGNELRKWFGHVPARWDEFQARYRQELRSKEVALQKLRDEAKEHKITLLFGARDTSHNEAVILRNVLLRVS